MTKLPKRLAFGEIKKRFRGAVSPNASLDSLRMKPKFTFALNNEEDQESDIISVYKIVEETNLDVSKLDESHLATSDNSLLLIRKQDESDFTS